jgi:hypothetical protein
MGAKTLGLVKVMQNPLRILFSHRIASNALQSEGHLFTFSEGHLFTFSEGHLFTFSEGHLFTFSEGHLFTFSKGSEGVMF